MKINAHSILNDAWGRPKTITDYSLFSGLFTYNVPDALWKIKENGTTRLTTGSAVSVGSTGGALRVTTTATNGNYSLVQSKRHPRYQPNRGHLYSSSIIVEDPTVGRTEFGLFTDDNGVFFRVKEGKLFLVRKSGGVEVTGQEAELDTDGNGYTNVFLNKGCIYDIQFQWRGVGNYYFYVNQQLVGTMLVLNTLEELSIENPALPIAFKCTNTGNGLPVLKCGCVDVTSEGGTGQNQQLRPIVSNSATWSNEVLLAVRVNETFNGKYNTRDLAMLRYVADVDKKCVIESWVTRDTTAITSGTWVTEGDANISIIKPTTGGTVTFNESKAQLQNVLPCLSGVPNERTNPNPKRIDLFLTNGDILIYKIKGTSVGAQMVLELGEEV